MSDHGTTGQGPAEQSAVPAPATDSAAPDPAVEAARVRLAEWLTAQAPSPEFGATTEELAEWDARPVEEFLVFVPPGYANQLFLVADHGISSFAPSQQTLEDAIAAARSQT